jgi:4-diphosphocytidyl-2-C-methyl-D-erythritol kinase
VTRLQAHAKINLDLRVLGKRPDGYHELRTIFQTISLADEIGLTFEPAPETRVVIEGNVDIEDNLIARAARLFLAENGIGGIIRCELRKHIPMGAGLGGGSSDAAAVLRAMPALTGIPTPQRKLHAMAAQLGSDVPFFLYGGTAVGIGRGDEIFPLPPAPELYGLLVTPDIHVSTAEAYRALSARLDPDQAAQKREQFGELVWSLDLRQARNDFEAAVFELHPELARIRETLAGAGAILARMTGSGSAIFGLFEEPPQIAKLEARPFTLIRSTAHRRPA